MPPTRMTRVTRLTGISSKPIVLVRVLRKARRARLCPEARQRGCGTARRASASAPPPGGRRPAAARRCASRCAIAGRAAGERELHGGGGGVGVGGYRAAPRARAAPPQRSELSGFSVHGLRGVGRRDLLGLPSESSGDTGGEMASVVVVRVYAVRLRKAAAADHVKG